MHPSRISLNVQAPEHALHLHSRKRDVIAKLWDFGMVGQFDERTPRLLQKIHESYSFRLAMGSTNKSL